MEMFEHQELNFFEKINQLSDFDILNIASNHISEEILRTSLVNNKNFSKQIMVYETKLGTNSSIKLKPKKESQIHQIVKEAKAAQTGNDVKIDTKEFDNSKEITNILNTILKLKNLKNPLEKLPESAITIKRMKREVNTKIVDK